MKIILSKSNFAPENLAGEEYLFKNFTDDIFYLYINNPSIIVGRKQNTLAEINYDYIKEHNIPVVRRMSGGGAVFHDSGNLNFCFIMRNQNNIENDFSKYTLPIIEVLQSLGINAQLEGRNDLTINGKKFSGNAKYFSNKTLLQHGTILFTSKLSDLSQALTADQDKFNDKAVKSVQSRVTNISNHLKQELSLESFTDLLIKHITLTFKDENSDEPAQFYEFNSNDVNCISKLVIDKYNNWDWNFGNSPEYNYNKKIRTIGGSLQAAMIVKKGIIQDLKFYGDFFSKKDIDSFEKYFINTTHDHKSIQNILIKYKPEDYFFNISKDDILNVLF